MLPTAPLTSAAQSEMLLHYSGKQSFLFSRLCARPCSTAMLTLLLLRPRSCCSGKVLLCFCFSSPSSSPLDLLLRLLAKADDEELMHGLLMAQG